jgi:hypothetical protein
MAGTGIRGASGDDGPAVDAQIQSDYIGVSPSGKVYLSDRFRYRTVTSDGVIHPFAGSGVFGFSGDGGPALEARFGTVDGIASDRAGNVYIVDEANQRIRRVNPDGTVTTVAGSGKRGYTGDGGPALAATLQDPVMIAVDEGDGSLYFADHHNHVVRRVSTDGIISTVAGTGVQGFSGDCGPATEAQLDQPWGIAIHDSVLFIADMGNNRVRMVVP